MILVETRERERLAAGDAESPVGVDPLVVGEVTDDLLQRPLARSVAKAGDLTLRQRLEQLQRRPLLRRQRLDRVVASTRSISDLA